VDDETELLDSNKPEVDGELIIGATSESMEYLEEIFTPVTA
jgi:hypothetical protein